MTARIVITDYLSSPVIGTVEKDSTFIGTVFTLSNYSNAGVAAWRWTLIDKGIGSSAALSSGTSATPQITPDIAGPYFLRLQTYSDAGATVLDDQDEQLIGVAFPTPYNWQVPAAGETSQRGSRGWATPVEKTIRDLRAFVDSGGSPSGAAGGDLDDDYPNPIVAGLSGVPIDVSANTPSPGDALVYDGTNYKPTAVGGGGSGTSINALDDFHLIATGGGGWKTSTAGNAAAAVFSPSGSGSLVDLFLASGTSGGSGTEALNPALGLALDGTHPIARTFRIAVVNGSNAIADTQCEWEVGHACVDGMSEVLVDAAWSGSTRSYSLVVVDSSGTPHATSISSFPGYTQYADIRITATAAGATAEIAVDGGAFSLVATSSQAPTQGTYAASVSISVGSGTGARYIVLGSCRHTGDLAASATVAVGGDPVPTPFTGFGTSSSTACVGNDSRLSDARAPTVAGLQSALSTDTAFDIGDGSLGHAIRIRGSVVTIAGDGGDSVIIGEGKLASVLNADNNSITYVADPLGDQDAANKRYTDQPQTRSSSTTTPSALTAADIGGFIQLTNAGAITLPTADLSSALVSGRSLIVTVILTGGGTLTISDGSGCTHSGTPGALSCVLWTPDGVTWYVR